VIGVAASSVGYRPCRFPGQSELVNEDSHEFRNDQSGMGVVHLEGDVLMQMLYTQTGPVLTELASGVAKRAGDHEIFLDEAQLLAGSACV
jgi:hypothetical protein